MWLCGRLSGQRVLWEASLSTRWSGIGRHRGQECLLSSSAGRTGCARRTIDSACELQSVGRVSVRGEGSWRGSTLVFKEADSVGEGCRRVTGG